MQKLWLSGPSGRVRAMADGMQLTANDILRRLPDPMGAADVLAMDADVLSLSGTEREALWQALLGRFVPEELLVLRPLFGRPEPSPESWWPPRNAADVMRAGRAMARELGWNYNGVWPKAVVEGLAPHLLGLAPKERHKAAGLLAGVCGLQESRIVFAMAGRSVAAHRTEEVIGRGL